MRLAARLLLLVALLLPFRGALAVAGGWCHAVGEEAASAATVSHDHNAHAHHDHARGHGNAHERHAGDGQPLEANDLTTASCTFCTAVCAAPPLPAGGVLVHALLPIGAERFPALAPPCSTATFGALDRPPRSA